MCIYIYTMFQARVSLTRPSLSLSPVRSFDCFVGEMGGQPRNQPGRSPWKNRADARPGRGVAQVMNKLRKGGGGKNICRLTCC